MALNNTIVTLETELVITHKWVSGFGWENTVYTRDDFESVKIIGSYIDVDSIGESETSEVLLIATFEGKADDLLIRGYYKTVKKIINQ